ncbi:4-amino-4-deoxy-L-arabinose-phosphoundecaprenol flippase subunit ArnF [Paenibacillus konkukensis]|uniref:4-amino-4-deoxy-L-arabinose-phosphoundecaprenol flippase subunit ArnF n=2 Tax=Paenibacillus konkukensis TaxID=2020716 RepID=A0ABY4RP28_9BACL|nr:4-amino-4-deoxy-L-arabinose-phosphoundecaprenol flippase subunit ArnF [Paenibacillus konkukensis]
MFLKMLLLVAASCSLNATGNTLWKLEFSKKPLDFSSFSTLLSTFWSWKILLGMLSYFCSMLLFFYLLSKFKLSLIIPLTSLTYILNLGAAFFLFKEKISMLQLLGTLIIIAGILVLMRANPVES